MKRQLAEKYKARSRAKLDLKEREKERVMPADEVEEVFEDANVDEDSTDSD